MFQRIKNKLFALVDLLFIRIDKTYVNRANNITHIPSLKYRKGGKTSYAEWAHVIGIFQTILFENTVNKTGNKVLDIGCGTGLLGIASKNIISEGGEYTGIDVIAHDISFDLNHYDQERFKFIHFDLANPTYAGAQSTELKPWPVKDESYDMVTALSVWTHLKEEEAIYYFKEISRVLKPGGRALVTFFILDENYKESLKHRTNSKGRFHSSNQLKWVFDQSAYNSLDWFCPKWVKHPEDAIGITSAGLKKLVDSSNLSIVKNYSGNWKEQPGIYFQDVLIFEKS